MLEAIGNAESDTCGLTKEAFLADGKTQLAVIESLIVIGEASGRIVQTDPSVEDTYPQHCGSS
ncbi:MAG: HepT-like ribonuclease domain-containing protein [Rhodocyclaceae bacterium]